MTVQNKWQGTTVVAGADLTVAGNLYKAVAVGGTIAATSALSIGLLQSKGSQNTHVTVGINGEMKAFAGAAITSGARLSVTTSGFIIAATSGAVAVGKALEAANSGDLFRGYYDFAAGGLNAF
jgi:hypothetical protein